jgi:two-component system sensor histidine kinase KdpD
MNRSDAARASKPTTSATTARLVWGYVAALLLVAVTTGALLLLRERLTLANVSLIYVLLTLIVAVRLGTGPSVLAAVLSFFGGNFFFVRPYYSLHVADPRDLLDLLVFLAAALIAGRLAAYARQQAEAASLNAEQQEILYNLTSALNPLTEPGAIRNELRRTIQERLGATSVEFLPAHGPGRPASGATAFVLLEAGETVYGTLRAEFPQPLNASRHRLLLACAGQAALALQRVDLTGQAQRGRALAEADRLKTAILHAVSHDLRTPITIIKSSAANLDELHDRLPPEEQRELARAIETQADELDRLVGNLLDLSRLQAGAVVLNEELNSLEEIAGEAAARAYKTHRAERIALDFPDDLPLVRCDYGLLLQALNNIVDNSLRHEPAGKRVIIRGRALADAARLEVANHGPNIAPEERARVMEPFYQTRDGRSQAGGVGLGLAIARGVVEAHGGRLHIEDTPGGGATFVITLPRDTKYEIRDTRSERPSESASRTSNLVSPPSAPEDDRP